MFGLNAKVGVVTIFDRQWAGTRGVFALYDTQDRERHDKRMVFAMLETSQIFATCLSI